MKKIFSILVVVTFLAACSSYVAEFKQTALVSKDSTEVCVIKYKLPTVSEASGKYGDLCETINSERKNKTNEILINFKKEAFDFYNDFVKDSSEPSAIRYEYYGDYDMFFADAETISYRYINYLYTGGAHGNTTFDSYNYDVKEKKLLKFDDVFKTDDASMNKLNTLLVEYFKNKDNCFTDNPKVNREYNMFNIQKDTVSFTFNQYELGAYSCGSPVVKVPVVILKQGKVYKR